MSLALIGIAAALIGGFTIGGVILRCPGWPWYAACLGTTCLGMVVPLPWIYGWIAWAGETAPVILALVIMGLGIVMFVFTAAIGWYGFIVQAVKKQPGLNAANDSDCRAQ